MKKDFKIQVLKEHYYNEYDSLSRFISYFYQIKIVKELKPEKILEIGIGNRTVSNYLKWHGFNLVTCDFDINLNPDYLCDIRETSFKNNSFDLVMSYEVLEHMPFEDFESILKELNRISKKNVIISIPYHNSYFEIIFKNPIIKNLFKKDFIDIFFRIPIDRNELPKDHYWEMGKKGYSRRKIKKILEKYFIIVKEISPVLNHYHHFFILKKYD